ncbi:MAG: hypothetical protein LUC93_17660 [Planctomycetaceae bacterium]|nr:hypothetical protein [Planctomycetaceae bacterium]
MAIDITQTSITCLGDGSVQTFPLPFPVLDKAHVFVSGTSAAGEPVTYVNGVDYTVAITTGANGVFISASVTLARPLAAGWEITIARVVPLIQRTTLPNQGPMTARSIEKQFDYLTMIDQQQDEAIRHAGDGIDDLEAILAVEVQARADGDAGLSARITEAQNAASAAATLASQAKEAARTATAAAVAAEDYARAAQEAADVAVADATNAVRIATVAETAVYGKAPLDRPVFIDHIRIVNSYGSGQLWLGNGGAGIYGGPTGDTVIAAADAGHIFFQTQKGSSFRHDSINNSTGLWEQGFASIDGELWVGPGNVPVVATLNNKLNLVGGILSGNLHIFNTTGISRLFLVDGQTHISSDASGSMQFHPNTDKPGSSAQIHSNVSGALEYAAFDPATSTWIQRLICNNNGLVVRGYGGNGTDGVLWFGDYGAHIHGSSDSSIRLSTSFMQASPVGTVFINTNKLGALSYDAWDHDTGTWIRRFFVDGYDLYYNGVGLASEIRALKARVAALDGQAATMAAKSTAPAPQTDIWEALPVTVPLRLGVPLRLAVALPEVAYILNSTGTYHLTTCSYASENGELLTVDAIRTARPDAKPCSRCNPPAL